MDEARRRGLREFAHTENIGRFKKLLAKVTDERQREQLNKLLAEEENDEPA